MHIKNLKSVTNGDSERIHISVLMGSTVWIKKMVSHTVSWLFKIFTVYRWKQASVSYGEEDIKKEAGQPAPGAQAKRMF